jgi:dCTP deaminase
MSVLSRNRILEELKKGSIVIEPFDIELLSENSYDVTLGNKLKLQVCNDNYKLNMEIDLDDDKSIPDMYKHQDGGLLMTPDMTILGVTQQYTETYLFYPKMEGKSSLGRQFLGSVDLAGSGDIGFKGYWTLELTTRRNVRLFTGMKIAQLLYYTVDCTESELKRFTEAMKSKSNTGYSKKGIDSRYNNNEQIPIEARKNYDK